MPTKQKRITEIHFTMKESWFTLIVLTHDTDTHDTTDTIIFAIYDFVQSSVAFFSQNKKASFCRAVEWKVIFGQLILDLISYLNFSFSYLLSLT